jgi:hypothetical protein
MSAYVSISTPEAAILLTDGAATCNGLFVGDFNKVFAAKSAPVAVTFCGDQELGEMVAADICAAADDVGPGHAIGVLPDFARQMKTMHIEAGNPDIAVDVLVTAFVPGVGGVHRAFKTRSSTTRPAGSAPVDVPAFTVIEPPRMTSTHRITADDLDAATIPLIEPGEPELLYWYRNGADIMEMLRRQKIDWKGGLGYGIGGHVDLTTISAAGVRTERLRTWPDKIGERISPTPGGLNRHHRRAMAGA